MILNSVGISDLPNEIPITLVHSRDELMRLSEHRLGNIQVTQVMRKLLYQKSNRSRLSYLYFIQSNKEICRFSS